MPAFKNTGKGDGKKVPGVEMSAGKPHPGSAIGPYGFDQNKYIQLGGDQGGVRLGGGGSSNKKVPGGEIKGRALT